MIGAIRFTTNDNCKAFIYPVGMYGQIDWGKVYPSCLGNDFVTYNVKPDYKPSNSMSECPIIIEKGLDGNYVLRFVETVHYMLRMEGKDNESAALPHFHNEDNLDCKRDVNSLSFRFVNYLGRSKLYFGDHEASSVLLFEVVPDKMNYEDDYISLTEALAEFCSSMLLEYTGSTSNVYSQSIEEQRTLLEQFIFLRQFCYAQNLQMLFEAVKRNPDRILEQAEEYMPLGLGRPSKKFYTSPFSYSRNWAKLQNTKGQTRYMPQEVAVARKYDSLDTPANRFIKFALQKFNDVCIALLEKLNKSKQSKQAECYEEAKALHNQLDNIFRDRFFDDIGTLDIMPQNNQVLQKREGYSQIFSASSMLDLALQLDWQGKDEVYEGESKNVALLYEYWLFFELFKIIKNIDGCEMLKTRGESFITVDDGLTISLKQGKETCQSFVIKELGVKINLYYNRTFKSSDFKTTRYEGSYSRPFRPDFTLAIFPDDYSDEELNGEKEAIEYGAVSYVHFDAKYRVTKLTDLIGERFDDDSKLEEALTQDKKGAVIDTYKRGDLLKMHTYNDAIRRTIGSYVLYPGSYDSSDKGKRRFKLYDEILPGVGAFAIKPSIADQGENELKMFIISLIETKRANYTRLNRDIFYNEIVLREPPLHEGNAETGIEYNQLIAIDQLTAIGYIRADSPQDYYYFLKENNYLQKDKEFIFYFYAIKGTNVYTHHKDIFRAGRFRFFKNQISKTDSYIIEPICCKIKSNELVSRSGLVNKLKSLGYDTNESRHHADFYYILTVCVIDDDCPSVEYKISEVNSKNGNDTFSPHSPKVLVL